MLEAIGKKETWNHAGEESNLGEKIKEKREDIPKILLKSINKKGIGDLETGPSVFKCLNRNEDEKLLK